MAIVYTAWQADGKGQAEIKHLRSDAQGYGLEGRDRWIAEQKGDRACVLITKARTDRQSNIEHIVWQRPGYVDPVATA